MNTDDINFIIKSICKLQKDIDKYNFYYYIKNKSIISDIEYDKLFQELTLLELKYPQLIIDQSPTLKIGSSNSTNKFPLSQHKSPMLSLKNSFIKTDMLLFNNKILKTLKIDEIEYSCDPKIDGLAISLLYKNGNLIRASTRGNGLFGEDITNNAYTIKNIPLKLNNKGWPILLDIRGEVYMPKNIFEELNLKRKQEGKKIFSNPRHAASGSLRQLNPKITANRFLEFVAYGFGGEGVFYNLVHTQIEALNILNSWGIPISNELYLAKNIKYCFDYYNYIHLNRYKLKYSIDGVVFKVNNINLQKQLKYSSRYPNWAIAYKFLPYEITTKIKKIDFQVGRTGILTPVAVVNTVQLLGINISHATLHNIDELFRLNIMIGDTVIISLAGDVIPQITKVLYQNRKFNKTVLVSIPKKCNICNSQIQKYNNIYRCIGKLLCKAQLKQSIIHFINAIEIKGLGEKIIEKLININLIKSIADIFILTHADLCKVHGCNTILSKKLINSIINSKTPSLSKFIFSLGIPNVGKETAKNLAHYLGTFKNIQTFLPEVLMLCIPKIGRHTSYEIYNFFHDQYNSNIIQKMFIYGVNVQNNHTHINNNYIINLSKLIKILNIKYLNIRYINKLIKIYETLNNIINLSQNLIKLNGITFLNKNTKDSLNQFFSNYKNLEKINCIQIQIKQIHMHFEK